MAVQKDDQQIIRKIKDGELEYFSYLVHSYTKPIQSYIHRKLFEKEDADDIVQEVFLKFYKNIEKFDDASPVLPYLYGIAKNELKMYIRSKKQTVPIDEKLAIEEDEVIDIDLDEALKSLSEKERKPIELLYEGYTYEEIASKLKKPVNTIKTIVRRTRLKLNKQHDKT